MLRLLLYLDSIYARLLLAISTLTVFIVLLIFLFNNPFSKYDAEDKVYVERPLDIKNIEFNRDTHRSKKQYKIKVADWTEIPFSPGTPPVRIEREAEVNKRKNNNRNREILVSNSENTGYVPINSLVDFQLHPLPPFFIHEDRSILILGTTENGSDLLSTLVSSAWATLLIIIHALSSFLFFGILFGVIIGYYQWGKGYINTMINFITKIIESTPLVLWIFLSVIFVQLFSSTLAWEVEYRLIFTLVGLFSSPALGQLIADRIKALRSEDFIVALKLLGLPNRQIIFNHILKHYCLTDILFQGAYICAQVMFLDFTLAVLEFSYPGTWGSDLWVYYQSDQIFPMYAQLVLLFSFTTFFFYLGRYFELQSKS